MSSLLVGDVYLWKWLEAGLTKAFRRKMRSQLLKGLIPVAQQQALLLRCGYTQASTLGWSHPSHKYHDRERSAGFNYPTDLAFARLTSSVVVWMATGESWGLRRYYWHCVRTNKPVGLSTKVKLLVSAGFVMGFF